MSLKLRVYQEEITDKVRQLMINNQKKILVCSPTGSGKTALTANMLKRCYEKGMKAVFIVHRRELVNQSARAFHKAEVPFGIISRGFPRNDRANIQIASIQTLARRMHVIEGVNLVIWDECHHVAAGSWDKVYKSLPNAFHIGLTATPERLDGQGLGQWFDVLVKGPTVKWLIEENFLSDYLYFEPPGQSFDNIRSRFGDFSTKEAEEAVDKPTITGSVVREYMKVAMGKRAVVFCVSVKHSAHVVDEFNKRGIPAVHVDGDTKIGERDMAIKRFESGEIKVLSNVDLFGEGFDLPNIEVACLLRPTQSLGLFLQQVGRALRTAPGKDKAIILDHVGNRERHGFPCDEREWDLNSSKRDKNKKPKKNEDIKICERCFAVFMHQGPICKHCGYENKKQERVIDEVEGDLVQIDRDQIQKERKAEQSKALSLNELIELGKKRGYKKPEGWAKHIFNARQAKKITQTT